MAEQSGSAAFPSRIFAGLPPHAPGQTIGVFGGSFNPPHEGHRHASVTALRRLKLDQLWWMVTPGNPLKENGALPPMDERMRLAADMAAHPRIMISGAEAGFRTRYTADLIRKLKDRSPGTRFVWIMGSDSLTDFHRWENWRELAHSVPIAIINRPRSLVAPLTARAAQTLAPWRIDSDDAATLPWRAAPAWVFLVGPRVAASSTAIRGAQAAPVRDR